MLCMSHRSLCYLFLHDIPINVICKICSDCQAYSYKYFVWCFLFCVVFFFFCLVRSSWCHSYLKTKLPNYVHIVETQKGQRIKLLFCCEVKEIGISRAGKYINIDREAPEKNRFIIIFILGPFLNV